MKGLEIQEAREAMAYAQACMAKDRRLSRGMSLLAMALAHQEFLRQLDLVAALTRQALVDAGLSDSQLRSVVEAIEKAIQEKRVQMEGRRN